MRAIQDYLSRVAPEHADKPKFMATIAMLCQPFLDLQAFLASLPQAFDVDYAVGVQLDQVGQRVGVSRDVLVPIVNVFFSFDDAPRGFDLGYWQGPYSQAYGIQAFDDDTYRKLIRAKIIANSGDGSVSSAINILTEFLSGSGATFFVYADDDGLSGAPASGSAMYVGFSGTLPSLVDMICIAREYLPIRPSGTSLTVLGTSVNGDAMFGFDVNNEYIGGFDQSAWGMAPDDLAQIIS